MKNMGRDSLKINSQYQRSFTEADLCFIQTAFKDCELTEDDLKFIFENPVLRQPLLDSRDILQRVVKEARTAALSPYFYFLTHVRHLLLSCDITDPYSCETVTAQLLDTHQSVISKNFDQYPAFDYPLINLCLIQKDETDSQTPHTLLIFHTSHYTATFQTE